MPTVKDENYYTVCGWMLNRLHLKGNDLIVYALIYSFSQDGESEFKGTLAYLTEFTGAGINTVKRSLGRLEDIGYIEKTDRNVATGEPNTFKIVPLDKVTLPQEGVAQNGLPPSPKWSTPQPKMGSPVAQNGLPYINNDINKDSKERKKNKKIINNNNLPSAGAREGEELQFGNMTDEELTAWGQQPPDFSKEGYWDIFNAYCAEVERRRGKTVDTSEQSEKAGQPAADACKGNGGGNGKQLKSHSDILDEWGVSPRLNNTMKDFLRHCYLNGHIISNATLEDILFRLETYYGDDDEAKCDSVKLAISSGYYDIKEFRGVSKII